MEGVLTMSYVSAEENTSFSESNKKQLEFYKLGLYFALTGGAAYLGIRFLDIGTLISLGLMVWLIFISIAFRISNYMSKEVDDVEDEEGDTKAEYDVRLTISVAKFFFLASVFQGLLVLPVKLIFNLG